MDTVLPAPTCVLSQPWSINMAITFCFLTSADTERAKVWPPVAAMQRGTPRKHPYLLPAGNLRHLPPKLSFMDSLWGHLSPCSHHPALPPPPSPPQLLNHA